LRKALGYLSCFVADDDAMFILLVLENPLGVDNIAAMVRSLHNGPYIIPLEVVWLFLHSKQPIQICKGFKDLAWLHQGDKGAMIAIFGNKA
jgi:hypothetical protein